MTNLTNSKLYTNIEEKSYLSQIRFVNKLFRNNDESHLWPIRNKFNATERAIRIARKYHNSNGFGGAYEYALLLDGIISEIVNNENNW